MRTDGNQVLDDLAWTFGEAGRGRTPPMTVPDPASGKDELSDDTRVEWDTDRN